MRTWVLVDGSLSHSGEDEWKFKPIDRCIRDVVVALTAGGVRMFGSCCGHGERAGEIALADGRVLRVGVRRE